MTRLNDVFINIGLVDVMTDWFAPFLLAHGPVDRGIKYQIIHSLFVMFIYNLSASLTAKECMDALWNTYRVFTKKKCTQTREIVLKSSNDPWTVELTLSNEFIAILHKINCRFDDGRMVEIKSDSIVDVGPALYFPIDTESRSIGDGFSARCSMQTVQVQRLGKCECTVTEYTICVEAACSEPKSVRNFIKQCRVEYDEVLENDLDENLFVFFTDRKAAAVGALKSICHSDDSESTIQECEFDVGFSEYKIPAPSKKFDTVFFAGKDDLFQDLKTFIKGK